MGFQNLSIIIVVILSSLLLNGSIAIHHFDVDDHHHHHLHSHHGLRNYHPKCIHNDDWPENLSPSSSSLRSTKKTSFIWPQHDITTAQLDSSNHHHNHELQPLKIEYTLPPVYDHRQIILNEEDIFEPEQLFPQHQQHHHHKNTLLDSLQQFSIPSSSSLSSSTTNGWDDLPNSSVYRIRKTSSNNSKKKRKKISGQNNNSHRQQQKPLKEIYIPDNGFSMKNLSPPSSYSKLNKIIVIEETGDDNNGKQNNNTDIFNVDPQLTKQIVQSIFDSKHLTINNNDNERINYDFKSNNQYNNYQQPTQSTKLSSTIIYNDDHPSLLNLQNQQSLTPISTIKDLHDRLNETLLLNNLDYGNVSVELVNNNNDNSNYYYPLHNVTMITPYDSYNLSTKIFQTKLNDHIKLMNWSSLSSLTPSKNDSTTTTTTMSYSFPLRNDTYRNGTNEQLVSSGSTNQEWLSSSTTTTTSTSSPIVFYFTSERNNNHVLPTPSIITMPTTTTTTMASTLLPTRSSSIFYHRKFMKNHGNNSPQSEQHNYKHEDSIHKNNNNDDYDQNNDHALNTGKIASIIIAFCISILLLIGIILMFLHKDFVTDQINHHCRNQQRRNENHENGNQQQQSSSLEAAAINFEQQQHQGSSSSSLSSSTIDSMIITTQQIPSPPPPPPPTQSQFLSSSSSRHSSSVASPSIPTPKPNVKQIQQFLENKQRTNSINNNNDNGFDKKCKSIGRS